MAKRIFFIGIIIIMLVSILFSQDYRKAFESSGNKLANYINVMQKNKIIGILPFEADSEETSVLLSDIYAYYLKINNIPIVDRKELQKIIEEIKLSMTGIVNEKNSSKIGELSGADLLLTGNMNKLGDVYFITVKLIDVASSETLFIDTLNFEDKEFITIKRVEEYFAERKYPSTALFRSALVPGWGQFYNDQPIKGSFFFISTLGGIGTSYYYFSEYQKYINTTSEGEEMVKDQEKATNNFRNFTWVVGITFSIWIINIIDAYMNAR
ncbi:MULTISPECIES: DUF5683 domain-containing protein [unclassified Marinitoga]|uniref:DUF5683 domain-containing protein n=1 Tax=unclassified Marinitoga TaxID=2640159 RepID=UPI000640D59D|nr:MULTISPECIES: DUF5683 domain-containing protein [unclassified Marinitoga]KLO23494.1 hypothetical protein X274_06175 [Marinitoga sp. 1155]NUV00401.1 hypothetical protein [Marinitoga sp. 1154]